MLYFRVTSCLGLFVFCSLQLSKPVQRTFYGLSSVCVERGGSTCSSSLLCKSILFWWHHPPPRSLLRLSHGCYDNCHQDANPLHGNDFLLVKCPHFYLLSHVFFFYSPLNTVFSKLITINLSSCSQWLLRHFWIAKVNLLGFPTLLLSLSFIFV